MKLDFSIPRRVRLVYFGRIGLGILRNYITETNTTIYENPRIRLNVWVVLRMLLSGERSEFSYYRAFLRWTKPHAVITMEDNNVTFYATKAIRPTCHSIALQNGIRLSMSHSSDSTFASELGRVGKLGWRADVIGSLGGSGTRFYSAILPKAGGTRIVEVGNLINNASPVSPANEGVGPKRLIFISKYPNRGAGKTDPTWNTEILQYIGDASFTAEKYHSVEGVVARFCAEFARARGLNFVVLGKRPIWQTGERKFFEKYLGDFEWEYLPSTTQSSSYESVREDDYIVNIDSTLGYEFLSRGLRVAFVTARMRHAGHPEIVETNFGYPFVKESCGDYWTDVASRSEIFRVLTYVTSIEEHLWLAATESARNTLLIYDEMNKRFCQLLNDLQIANTGPRLWTRDLIPQN